MPAGDFRHFTPYLNPQDIVVGVSASGEFRDVLSVFTAFATAVCASVLPMWPILRSRAWQITSALEWGPSQVPVMTKTYASTLTAIHLLLLEFFEAPRNILPTWAKAPNAALRRLRLRKSACQEWWPS